MLQIRLVFMSHLYEMNWEMPWKDMQFRIFLQVYGAFPCVLNHSMSTQARKIGYKAKRQHYKTFVICVISLRRNGTWVKRDGGAGAFLNQAGFLLGWEPLWNCEQERKKKSLGNVSLAKMCWTTLTEINIAWAMCCSYFCVPEFPLVGRSGLPRRPSRVMTSSECTEGTAILIWALLASFPLLCFLFSQKGAVGEKRHGRIQVILCHCQRMHA